MISRGTAFWGAALIGAGASLLAINLGFDASMIARVIGTWPVLLVLIGVSLLVHQPIVSRILDVMVGLLFAIFFVSYVHSSSDCETDCNINIELPE